MNPIEKISQQLEELGERKNVRVSVGDLRQIFSNSLTEWRRSPASRLVKRIWNLPDTDMLKVDRETLRRVLQFNKALVNRVWDEWQPEWQRRPDPIEIMRGSIRNHVLTSLAVFLETGQTPKRVRLSHKYILLAYPEKYPPTLENGKPADDWNKIRVMAVENTPEAKVHYWDVIWDIDNAGS